MSSGKIVVGVLAGIAAGALLGVLFAPEKGSVSRKKIAKKGNDYVDNLKDKFDDLLESFTEKIVAIKEEGNDLVKKSKSRAAEVKDEFENLSS